MCNKVVDIKRGKFRIVRILFFLIVFLLTYQNTISSNLYVTTKARKGDGITVLLNRFYLSVNKTNIELFRELNPNLFDKYGGVLLGYRYKLPILKMRYNKQSIESSLSLYDNSTILKILEYNKKVEAKRLKSNYINDGYIWIPLYLTNIKPNTPAEVTKKPKNKKNPKRTNEPLFGKKYEKIKIKSKVLEGYVFYLISGHGGPDPGAIGFKNNNELHEDEYGYDITLRLAKNLLEQSAEVFIVVQDSSDGIRDNYYLNNSSDEIYISGDTISTIQKTRLARRADIVNQYSKKYPKNKQYCFIFHVDSRHTQKRIDIFFYYQQGNKKGRSMANTVYKTIKRKYDKNQPGRGYTGSVTTRNLYMLRNLNVPTIYVEIGNIQNPLDQIRLIESNNRQAIANWIRDGIINELK